MDDPQKKTKEKQKAQIIIAALGAIIVIVAAFICYLAVKHTIVENEKENMVNVASVNAHSLRTGFLAKSNLVYAALSGDMADEAAIEQNMLKIGEKGKYIPLTAEGSFKEWEKDQCRKAASSPGEVIAGPIIYTEGEYYAFYLTKAVYMSGSIAGYVQIELDLNEVYKENKSLSGNSGGRGSYCIVKNAEGKTVMTGQGNKQEEISFLAKEPDGCTMEWSYVVNSGIAEGSRKLVAYDSMVFGEETFLVCVIRDYDEIVHPIERISLYLSVLCILLLAWVGMFIFRIVRQQKEEERLIWELEYEKELNKANEALKYQESLMQKYNHSKATGILAGAIAHEFNNLLTPVVLYSELFEENEIIRNEMPEETWELKHAARRCEELARQLLDYTRQGQAEKVLVNYNATFAVQSSVNIVKKLLPENVKLVTHICNEGYDLCGQIGALNQIILNLATNAVHAMENTGGTITIRFGLNKENNSLVRLIVKDTGEGIPEEIRQNIFEPFYTTRIEKDGCGIGLTVVKRLVEEHGGDINVWSEVHKGTCFIMDFPVQKR